LFRGFGDHFEVPLQIDLYLPLTHASSNSACCIDLPSSVKVL
jgi:hypothetical protein